MHRMQTRRRGVKRAPPRPCACTCARQISAGAFEGCSYQCECLECPGGDRCRFGMTREIYRRNQGLCPCCTDVPCSLGGPRPPARNPDGSMKDEGDAARLRKREKQGRARSGRDTSEGAGPSSARMGAMDRRAGVAVGAVQGALPHLPTAGRLAGSACLSRVPRWPSRNVATTQPAGAKPHTTPCTLVWRLCHGMGFP